jgi:AN1-like zinc finger protein
MTSSGRKLRYADTTAAPRYGPTPIYGLCEAPGCESVARSTCAACEGDFCLGHVSSDEHKCVDDA